MAFKRAMTVDTTRGSLADPRHLMRYLKHQAGRDVAEIAKEEGVSVDTVKKSVNTVVMYRARNTTAEMDIAVRDVVISSLPKMKETFHGLLEATELVQQTNDKTGKTKIVKQPDKTTRLEAMRIGNTMIANLQPKTPQVEVNVKQTNQVANLSAAETNEERFRRLRKKAEEYNALPPEVAAVPDYIDAGDDVDDPDDDEDDDE